MRNPYTMQRELHALNEAGSVDTADDWRERNPRIDRDRMRFGLEGLQRLDPQTAAALVDLAVAMDGRRAAIEVARDAGMSDGEEWLRTREEDYAYLQRAIAELSAKARVEGL